MDPNILWPISILVASLYFIHCSGENNPFCDESMWAQRTGTWIFQQESYIQIMNKCVMEVETFARPNGSPSDVAIIESTDQEMLTDIFVGFTLELQPNTIGGIYIRTQSPVANDIYDINGYYFSIDPNAKQYTFNIDNTQGHVDVNYNEPIRIILKIIDFELTAYVNGQLIATVTDTNGLYSAGLVAFKAEGTGASFSNLVYGNPNLVPDMMPQPSTDCLTFISDIGPLAANLCLEQDGYYERFECDINEETKHVIYYSDFECYSNFGGVAADTNDAYICSDIYPCNEYIEVIFTAYSDAMCTIPMEGSWIDAYYRKLAFVTNECVEKGEAFTQIVCTNNVLTFEEFNDNTCQNPKEVSDLGFENDVCVASDITTVQEFNKVLFDCGTLIPIICDPICVRGTCIDNGQGIFTCDCSGTDYQGETCDELVGTNSPSKYPSLVPTIAPVATAGVTCNENDIGTFDWNELTEKGIGIDRNPPVTLTINDNDLSLNIVVELEYLGAVSADNSDTLWGVTYVLDFEDFDAHLSAINEPGTCQNRNANSFINKDFYNDYWTYSLQPFQPNGIGNINTLAYPPPNSKYGTWDLHMKDCSTIVYEGTFNWNDLRNCKNYNENKEYTSVDNSNPNYLILLGTFYVNIVSPFWYTNINTNVGSYYRIYQLISQPFEIRISKSVYVIGSTNINVMSISIIAVYKEDNDNNYVLILLTETAEYMQLINPQKIIFPIANIGTEYELQLQPTAENGNDCINNKAFICSQLWKIYAINTKCDINNGIDFSGIYNLRFTPMCRNIIGSEYNTFEYCTNWLNKHPTFLDDNNNENNIQNGVILQTKLTFIDEICKPEIFTVQLGATMNFYPNDLFDNVISSDHLYKVGIDYIFGEIILNFPTETEYIFDSKLINVWLCTFPPNINPLPLNQNDVNGGCFSNERDGFDDESSNFFFHIYDSQSIPNILAEEEFEIIQQGQTNNNPSDRIQFKFKCPNEIQRDKLYIHAQIEVILEELNENRRRRILLTESNVKPKSNKISHVGHQIGIINENKFKPKQPITPIVKPIIEPPQPISTFILSLNSWIVIIGSVLTAVMAVNIGFMCYNNSNNNNNSDNCCNKNKRKGYKSVQIFDSDDLDESQLSDLSLIDEI